jgi:hypothetical protein
MTHLNKVLLFYKTVILTGEVFKEINLMKFGGGEVGVRKLSLELPRDVLSN